MNSGRRVLGALIVLCSATLPAACERVENPATGEREYTTLTPEQEAEIGEQQHPQVLQQFGGAYDDPELQAYVDQIGQRVAAASDLPDAEFTFTLLDSDVVNAFALPGGYVYITRGLLALAENEAEVAGVLGHEVAHVTARHAAQRHTQATGAGLLATLGTIGAAILGGQPAAELTQQVAGFGAQAWLAGYSRDQEFQADELGLDYMAEAGYAPRALATFLRKLHLENELARRLRGQEGGAGIGWFATHPATLDRVEQAAGQAADSAENAETIGREAFLIQIDGMIYGENPSQGLIRGNRFIHPDLGFAFDAPSGFRLINTPAAVIARGEQGRLMIFDMAALEGGGLERYVAEQGLRQIAQALQADLSRPRNVQTFTVDGLPAASATASVAQGQQQADVALVAIEAGGDRIYRFFFLSPGQMSRGEAEAYQATIESFRRLAQDEAAAFDARRIEVVPVDPGDGVEELAARMAVEELSVERFEVLNALAVTNGLEAGAPVKLVR